MPLMGTPRPWDEIPDPENFDRETLKCKSCGWKTCHRGDCPHWTVIEYYPTTVTNKQIADVMSDMFNAPNARYLHSRDIIHQGIQLAKLGKLRDAATGIERDAYNRAINLMMEPNRIRGWSLSGERFPPPPKKEKVR